MSNKSIATFISAVIVFVFSSQVLALESIAGKVTVVEPTYMPDQVFFQMDTGTSSCPAGTWLAWNKHNIENHRAVLAALTTALVSQRDVNFFHPSDTCTGSFLHLLK